MDGPESGRGPAVRRRLAVTGVVQGVFYRDTCARRAHDLGVAGHVRNLPDGSVEVVVEGTPAAVDGLVSWCRVGPPAGRVDHVEVTEEPPTGASGFSVVA